MKTNQPFARFRALHRANGKERRRKRRRRGEKSTNGEGERGKNNLANFSTAYKGSGTTTARLKRQPHLFVHSVALQRDERYAFNFYLAEIVKLRESTQSLYLSSPRESETGTSFPHSFQLASLSDFAPVNWRIFSSTLRERIPMVFQFSSLHRSRSAPHSSPLHFAVFSSMKYLVTDT